METDLKRLTRAVLAEKNSMRGWIQVDPEKDLGSHQPLSATSPQEAGGSSFYSPGPPPRRLSDGDSYYIVSFLKDDREHQFTAFFHYFVAYREALQRLGLNEAFAQVAVSILDERDASKAGYISLASQLTQPQIERAQTARHSSEVDIQTPLGSLTGGIDSMRLVAALPRDDLALSGNDGGEWKFDLTIKAQGPPLPYLGSGIIPFDNDIDYEYALPGMDTSGTLTFGNNAYQVTEGISWFDREWGHFGPCKWTWMAMELPNGARIGLWDQQNNNAHPLTFAEGQSAFATILEPFGSIAVGSVDVLEEERFIVPGSQRSYPRRWSVSIPSKQIKLRVQLLRDGQEIIPKQEISSGTIVTPRLEARAEIEGTYEDQWVKGKAFVELFNLFPAFAAIRAQAAG
jgi:hypothetical protein